MLQLTEFRLYSRAIYNKKRASLQTPLTLRKIDMMKEITYILKQESIILQFDKYFDNAELIRKVKLSGITGNFEIQRVFIEAENQYIYWHSYVNEHGAITGQIFPIRRQQ